MITTHLHIANTVPEQKISTKPSLNLFLNPTLSLIFMFAKHNHLFFSPLKLLKSCPYHLQNILLNE